MKRIYEESRIYGKYLAGYEYKGYYIEIEEEFIGMYGNTKKWYKVVLKNGETWSSDLLKDIKRHIDEKIEEKN